MAILDYKSSIRKAPKKFIKYILDKEKNKDLKYVSQLNTSIDIEDAFKDFKNNFERYSKENFRLTFSQNQMLEEELVRLQSKSKLKKQKVFSKVKVRIHHYVQSWAKGEVTPEEANKIGLVWAKKCFGEKAVVVVSTHIDRNHIHNHIAVSPYTLDGKKINSTYDTLERYRKISDDICREHGLAVLVPKTKCTMKYKEWLEVQKGNGWKHNLSNKIDEYILRDDVKTIEDLKRILEEEDGFKVRLGKYMTIKLHPERKEEKGIRTNRLGDGYELDELKYRIEHKEKEMSLAAIAKMPTSSQAYYLYYRKIQIEVFQDKRVKKTNVTRLYKDLLDTAEMITYTVNNHIGSKEKFKSIVDEQRKEMLRLEAEIDKLKRRIVSLNDLSEDDEDNQKAKEEVESQLKIAEEELSKLKTTAIKTQCHYAVYEDMQNDEKYREAVLEQKFLIEEQNRIAREEYAKINSPTDTQKKKR